MTLLVLFFLFRIALANSGRELLLGFYMDFRAIFTIFCEERYWNFHGDYTQSVAGF